ncbi:hypothetical protein Tco_0072757 [Tanacetum coccineum]
MWYTPKARLAFYDDETEYEMRLQDYVKVANPFDVTYREEKVEENPFLERTADVVTQPLDQIVNLASVPIEQEIQTIARSPPIPAARKRASVETPAGEFAVKKQKGKALIFVSFTISPLRSTAATKVKEFVPAITSAPSKWLKSYVKGTGGRSVRGTLWSLRADTIDEF